MASSFIDSKTFAYFDPPYRPLTATANFTSYAQDGPDDTAQAELAEFINILSEKGTFIIASKKSIRKDDDWYWSNGNEVPVIFIDEKLYFGELEQVEWRTL